MWLTHGPLSVGVVLLHTRHSRRESAYVYTRVGLPNAVLKRLPHAQTAKFLAGPAFSADEIAEVGMEPDVKPHDGWNQRHQSQILAWTRHRTISSAEAG